ncbi:sigma-70 family RNA polymerase sigma factor [Agaribacter marinus]|uniref:RNA polymerase sigma factor n=1 Tax=Agaribacter marinus TaxID=1431249 RepID=A0AA37WG28_9ALTE|nr:sigma-70 family RNA polymerase sigma factor [Agaribacter marinus]GLR69601.1 RNA polymerase sigma factor [Agaribacter marinus]
MNKQNVLFTAFIRQHQAKLRAFIRSMGVQPDAVDDVAQEAFVIAYKELTNFDLEMDFGNWLCGIARNVVRNDLRKRARQHRILNEKLTYFLMDEADTPDMSSEQHNEEIVALKDCIKALPDKSRELIVQRYSDEHTSQALSEHYGMSATSVRLTLMRIRKKLRSCVNFRLEYEQ